MFRFDAVGTGKGQRAGALEPAGGAREPDDELCPGPDPWKWNPLGRHDGIAGELHAVGERRLAGAPDRVVVRDPAVPPFHAELVFPHGLQATAEAAGTQAPW